MVFPTLCELADIPCPQGQLEGASFKALLADPGLRGKAVGFARYGDGEAVITAVGIYTRFEDGEAVYFDHSKDPDENHNVVDDPAYAEVVQELEALLFACWAKYPDAYTSGGAGSEAP